jgi:hypothetical protein
VRYLLEQGIDIHRQIKSQTMNWKMLRATARLVVRTKVFSTKLLRRVAESSGLTALHYAARRGDVEIVEMLMEYKANPSIKNDLGRDVLSYCDSFPEIKGAIERVKREAGRDNQQGSTTTEKSETRLEQTVASKTTSQHFTLQRRLSTAIDVKYGMYLLSLHKMMRLFGSSTDRKNNYNLCHQDLLKNQELIRYEDLPMNAFVMFVSHQWLGYDHPDPNGVQISTLCTTLRRLRDRKIEHVSTDTFHVRLYRHSHKTYQVASGRPCYQMHTFGTIFGVSPSPPFQRVPQRSVRSS